MVMEFGPPARAPLYVAVHSSCTMPVLALGPVLAGAASQAVGYQAVFAAAVVLAAAGAAVWLRVAEPRGRGC